MTELSTYLPCHGADEYTYSAPYKAVERSNSVWQRRQLIEEPSGHRPWLSELNFVSLVI